MSPVSGIPDSLGDVRELLFVVAGSGKQAALAALTAGDPGSIAWRVVQACERAELWRTEAD
jgi:hypothetical protein